MKYRGVEHTTRKYGNELLITSVSRFGVVIGEVQNYRSETIARLFITGKEKRNCRDIHDGISFIYCEYNK